MMSDINFEDESEVKITQDDLKEISVLAKQLLYIEMRILYHTSIIDSLKEDMNKIKLSELPAIMKRCQMQKFTLDNGVEVNVKDDVAVSIKKSDEVEAYDWLDTNGHGSLIKTKEEIFFDRNDDKLREQFEKMISKTKYKNMFSKKQSIHAATLKAFFKDYIEEHGEVEEDIKKLFGVYQYKIANLKVPKDIKL